MSSIPRLLGLVAAHRAAAFLVAATASALLADGEVGAAIWRRWDADIYLDIAEHGYRSPRTVPYAEAFLPLYPLVLRAGMVLGLAPVVTGLVVTVVATAVATVALWRWVEREHDATAAGGAVLVLLLAPTVVALVAPYSESLFLAGAILAWDAARRGQWDHRVAVPAAVACGSRLAGAFLLVGLAVEAWQQRRSRRTGWRRPATVLALAALPLLGYLAWLAATRGDALYVLEAQRLGWDRRLVGPVAAGRTTWGAMWGSDLRWALNWGGELAAAVVGVLALVWLARRREWPAVAYLGPLWLGLLSSTWFYSLPRMLLAFFPVLPLIGAWLAGGRWRRAVTVATLAPLAALGVAVFTRGGWFY